MKLIKVASLGTDNKVCYNAVGEMFHVPKNFRATITVGSYATIISKHFDQSSVAVLDADNKPTGEVQLVDKPFDRLQVSSIGTKDEILANAGESNMLDKELDLWVTKATAEVAVKYDISQLKPA